MASLLNEPPSESGAIHKDSIRDGDVVDGSSEEPGVIALAEPLARGVDTGSKESRPRDRDRRLADAPMISSPDGAASEAVDDADSTGKRHMPDDEALPPGERIFGPYTLLRRLAFGGMGEVFLGRRDSNIEATLGVKAPGLARLVVIKRILNHMRRDDKHRRMFLDEARLQTALRSAHIVQIHDVGEADGMVFLAMEHVHGPSWRALIDRCRRAKQHLPVSYVVEMMIQACEGLSYAHNLVDAATGSPLRIVHRDVNPHNVLITYDGVIKVIDFGIAKSELRENQTETGTIKGKFAYMSPEQSAAEPLDARSDLFALGICLYELLTLTNPFKKGNIVLSLEAIQKLDPKPVSALRPGAAFLQPIVERMLRKNPDERFFDCAEVADALRQLQQDGLVPEPRAPLPTWLRELFAEEILSHMRVLEATGSDVDVASSSVRLKQTGGFGNPRVTDPGLRSPPGTPAPVVVDDVPRAESLLPEGHGTGPTGALALEPRATRKLWAASVGVVVAVCAVVVGGFLYNRSQTKPPPQVVAPVVPVVVDAGVVVVAVPVVVDAGVVVAEVVADAGLADELPAGVEEPVPTKSKKPPLTTTKKPPLATTVEAEIVGKVAVSAEGFVVKGGRNVPAKGAAVLVVDDKEAPFKLKLKVSVDDGGAPLLSLESDPWAIVRVDSVGKGKTPVSAVALTPGKKTQLSLQNPSGAAMDVSVTFASKTN